MSEPLKVPARRSRPVAPAAVRFFASSVMGSRDPITEKDLTPNELKRLQNAVEKARSEGRSAIGYGDYGEKEPWADGTRAALNAVTDPGASMAFTLGTARFHEEDDAIVITDDYDFNATRETVNRRIQELGYGGAILDGLARNGLLGVGNVIGNMVLPEGRGRKVTIRMPKGGGL